MDEELRRLAPQSKEELERRAAQFHNISFEQLAGRPDYRELCEKYVDSVMPELVAMLKEKFELTDVQAWAFLIESMRGLG